MGDGGFPCDSLQQAYLPKFTIAEERCSYIFWWLGTDFETLTVKNAIAHIRFVISQKIVLGSEDSIRNSWCLFTPIMVRFDQLTNKKRDVKAQNHNAQPWGEEMQDARWWQSPYNAYLPNVEYMYISLYNARSNIECKILFKSYSYLSVQFSDCLQSRTLVNAGW